MAEDEQDACSRCCEEASNAAREGGLVHGGYGSVHDCGTFAVLDEASVPEGSLCDECVNALIESGSLEFIGHFGEVRKGLKGASYAQVFRARQEATRDLLTKSASPIEILMRLAPVVADDPERAGMIAALLEAAGYDISDVAERYGDLMERDQRERTEVLSLMLDSIGETWGSA